MTSNIYRFLFVFISSSTYQITYDGTSYDSEKISDTATFANNTRASEEFDAYYN